MKHEVVEKKVHWLGLWIVRSIIERHQGRIDLTRTEDGRTRFAIELPRGVAE